MGKLQPELEGVAVAGGVIEIRFEIGVPDVGAQVEAESGQRILDIVLVIGIGKGCVGKYLR